MNKIPVTVLTGYLGAGKTTLLNRILSENHGQRIAVIENEFGEIGVDQDLVIRADEEIFEMNNGCICCTVRGDLIRILGNLMKRRDRFDRILIETTGLADPGPVAQTFFVDDEMRESMSLDGVVTLVDARHLALHLDSSDEARAQIAFADVILLNKVDLVTSDELDALEARLRGMNGIARIRRVHMAQTPMSDVLELGGFDLERALAVKPTFLEPEYPFEWAAAFDLPAGSAVLRLDDGPDPQMSVVVVAAPAVSGDLIDATAERVFASFSGPGQVVPPGGAISVDGSLAIVDLLRPGEKTFEVRVPTAGRYVMLTEHLPEEFDLRLETADGSRLVPSLERRYAAAHSHDDTVGSVAVEFGGALDGEKVNAWLSRLLQTQGKDIYRMKGFIDVAGSEERFVFQGVHMLFDGQAGGAWGAGPRTNRMVFIGRNLDRDALVKGLRACAA